MKLFPNKFQTERLLRRPANPGKVATCIGRIQRKLADYLQLKSEGISTAKKKVSLLVFSLLCCGCSVAVMLYSFLIVDTPIANRSITFPKYAIKNEIKLKHNDSLISYHEYFRINQFKCYLEHLHQDTTKSRIYDSIMSVRPHLLDSIHLVDSLFLAQ